MTSKNVYTYVLDLYENPVVYEYLTTVLYIKRTVPTCTTQWYCKYVGTEDNIKTMKCSSQISDFLQPVTHHTMIPKYY